MTWDGHTEGSKLVSRYYFMLLRYSRKSFLEAFSVTSGFFGSGSLMGSIPDCEEDPVKVVEWLVAIWVGETTC